MGDYICVNCDWIGDKPIILPHCPDCEKEVMVTVHKPNQIDQMRRLWDAVEAIGYEMTDGFGLGLKVDLWPNGKFNLQINMSTPSTEDYRYGTSNDLQSALIALADAIPAGKDTTD